LFSDVPGVTIFRDNSELPLIWLYLVASVEGASLRQIAEALGIGYGTVRARLQKVS
jgi:hypothetical protein